MGDDKNLMEQEKEFQLGDLLRRLIFLVRKNWLLMILVVLVFLGGGIGYGYYRKPMYIASEQARYMAKLDSNETATEIYDHTISVSMLSTFVDFCDTPVVIARANYYYSIFEDLYEGNEDKLDDLFAELKRGADQTLPDYLEQVEEIGVYTGDSFYEAGRISVTKSNFELDESPNFNLVISYKDVSEQKAKTKVKILLFAIAEEANVESGARVAVYEPKKDANGKVVYDEDGKIVYDETKQTAWKIDYKYFEAKITLLDRGYKGASVDISKSKIIFIAGILGIVAAFCALFVVQMLDRTIRDKDELEGLTGSGVLSIIPNDGGGVLTDGR